MRIPPFVIRKSVLVPLECLSIIDSSRFRIRYYRSRNKTLNRRVDIAYVSHCADPALYRGIRKLASDANVWGLTLARISEEMRIQRYRKGDYSNTHSDYDYTDRDFSKLTIVIPLVDQVEWEGGELEIGNSCIVPRLGIGDAVIFPSFIPHAVTRIERGTRVVLSAWVSGPPLK